MGIEVSQVKEGIFISQKKYTKSILQKFKMMDCKFVAIPLAANEKFRKDDGEKKINCSLYRSLIGSSIYFTSTSLDILFAASLLSEALSRIFFCYLREHIGVISKCIKGECWN